jgi:hypothetical protein
MLKVPSKDSSAVNPSIVLEGEREYAPLRKVSSEKADIFDGLDGLERECCVLIAFQVPAFVGSTVVAWFTEEAEKLLPFKEVLVIVRVPRSTSWSDVGSSHILNVDLRRFGFGSYISSK